MIQKNFQMWVLFLLSWMYFGNWSVTVFNSAVSPFHFTCSSITKHIFWQHMITKEVKSLNSRKTSLFQNLSVVLKRWGMQLNFLHKQLACLILIWPIFLTVLVRFSLPRKENTSMAHHIWVTAAFIGLKSHCYLTSTQNSDLSSVLLYLIELVGTMIVQGDLVEF